MEKSADGSCKWRCEKAELRAASKFETERQKQMEKMFSKLQEQFEQESIKEGTDNLKNCVDVCSIF